MAYFSIYNGLWGCYMPDSSYIVKADTRKELKKALQWEAYHLKDAGFVGMNQKAIAWLANAAWKNRKSSRGDYVAPYRASYQKHYPYALGVFTGLTRKEYLEQEEQS